MYKLISIFYVSKMASVLCGSVLFCPVRYRRPNGWADRAENWHKHSLELCDEDMGVGHHKCASMRVHRAQTCVQHHISSLGGQMDGPVDPQIGTNTHWDNGHKLWWSAIASAHRCARSARKHARIITHPV
jgi:hypothetical protein